MKANSIDADVIIAGAGPAGMSAAMWCVELGLKAILFEKEAGPGGQLLSIYNPITNYLGLETGNGQVMRDTFVRSLDRRNPLTRFSDEITNIDASTKSVITVSGERLTARALIIATGVRRRKLNVPGEEAFAGKGIIGSGSKEKENVKDKIVVIAGGGDAALENALILAEFATKVYVVHRRSELRARAEFVDPAVRHPKIEFRFETQIDAVKGVDRVESVELRSTREGMVETLPADIVLARLGVEPNTELLHGQIELDGKGYVMINSNCETTTPGIYAVGDVANPLSPTINSAAGMGSTAAKTAFILLAQEKAV